MKDTLWCDDLYMSTPFLSKYYELTGEEACLEDAVAQFLRYKERLFMPELQIMHHVYDMKLAGQTGWLGEEGTAGSFFLWRNCCR